MARFSQRTVNECYREERDLRASDDAAARTAVESRLIGGYGEAPTTAELDEASAHYAATHGDTPILFPKPNGEEA